GAYAALPHPWIPLSNDSGTCSSLTLPAAFHASPPSTGAKHWPECASRLLPAYLTVQSTMSAKSLHRLSDRFGDSRSAGWRREHLLFSAINDHSGLEKHGRHM